MAKEVAGLIKLTELKEALQIHPPPVGPALGSKGINIMVVLQAIQCQNPGQSR